MTAALVTACVLLGLPALAADAPDVAPSSGPGLAETFTKLMPELLGLLGTFLTVYLVPHLKAWLISVKDNQKASTAQHVLAGSALKLEGAVEAAMGHAGPVLLADLTAAAADGVVTPEEIAAAEKNAVSNVKSFLGAQGLGVVSVVFGLAGDALDSYLLGLVKAKVQAAQAAGAAAAAAAVPIAPAAVAGPAAVAVVNAGA